MDPPVAGWNSYLISPVDTRGELHQKDFSFTGHYIASKFGVFNSVLRQVPSSMRSDCSHGSVVLG